MHRYYAEQIGREGLVGLVFAQSPEFVAPHGAKKAVFGTNPIAISVPAAGSSHSNGNGNGSHSSPGCECVTMDMATAAYAWFGLLEAKTAGRKIPEDVALDAKGEPTTDPNEVRPYECDCLCGREDKGVIVSLYVCVSPCWPKRVECM